MKKVFLFVVVFALLFAGCSREDASVGNASRTSVLTPGIHHHSFWHDGARRTYDVYVPPNPVKGMPVLLALHGGGGNAERMRNMSGLDATANEHNFIVVYPQGSARFFAPKIGSWNAGECCGWAKSKNADDVGFIVRVIDEAIKKYRADERRVYVTGLSNGAQMSYRLACERPEKLAGIAPVGGAFVFGSCAPAEPVSVIHFHGKKDQCQPFDGADSCGGCLDEYYAQTIGVSPGEDEYSCESVLETIELWKTFNDAASEPRIIFDSEDTKCYKSEGAEAVAYCISESGGHNWPGASDDPCAGMNNYEACHKIIGSVAPVDWNNIMWEFFENN